ncbi:hypothetical protein [Planctomicrobium sp. SH664]|uniref:hypothetical protein n=1 Tax=Planctomicrobium sp. SH664 TaxID=3448125 RepID=UPI003F5C887E
MKTVARAVVLGLGLALVCQISQLTAADNDAAAPSAAAANGVRKGPLPANFGKLGISDDQRTKIYAIQDVYDARIESLKKEIQKLEDERSQKIEQVLTAGQKQRLKELRAAKTKKDAT